jgi:predicted DCC family thiol-disulfide oxidoreductase YuxK
MESDESRVIVYYDAACPRCIGDRARYERLAGRRAAGVSWVDVNAAPDRLRRKGIDPQEALRALHVEDEAGKVHSGLDAYAVLMEPVPILRPLGRLLRLPGLRVIISWIYRRSVLRRLKRQGRA